MGNRATELNAIEEDVELASKNKETHSQSLNAKADESPGRRTPTTIWESKESWRE